MTWICEVIDEYEQKLCCYAEFETEEEAKEFESRLWCAEGYYTLIHEKK